MTSSVLVSAAVEGISDEAALRKICRSAGLDVGTVYGRNGKNFVLDKLKAWNHAAQHSHWIVLLDLDNDYSCAPDAIRHWLPLPARFMCFRIAVRELESWLLADGERVAQYLRISRKLVPQDPDSLPDPKAVFVSLARHSRSNAIRSEMVPEAGSGLKIGPAYAFRIIEFINDSWRPEIAAQNSPSLRKFLHAIQRLKFSSATSQQ